jgi:hypothetical protein
MNVTIMNPVDPEKVLMALARIIAETKKDQVRAGTTNLEQTRKET